MESTIKREKNGRIECTVTFTEAEVTPAKEAALKKAGENVKIDGFRPGQAPADLIAEKVNPEQVVEETIRELLPDTFQKLTTEHEIQPVIAPKVEAQSQDPLVLTIVFVERPEVTLKGVDKIKIEKSTPSVDPKELDKMVNYILEQHQVSREVQREAKTDDKVTMDFHATDENNEEIEGTRSKDYAVVIGSKTLIPGFEDELIGMKTGDEKSFEITFPENYQAEHLRKKKATFYIKMSTIEEVDKPNLTEEFAKTVLKADSVDSFKKELENSMMKQEEDIEAKKREQKLLDGIREATKVDLPQELIDEETRMVVSEFEQQLSKQNVTLEQWMQMANKKAEDVHKEMTENAVQRITLRLGMQKLVEDKGVDISDEEMKKHIEELLGPVPADQRKEVEPMYQPGQEAFEQFKWQKKVEKVMDEMLS